MSVFLAFHDQLKTPHSNNKEQKNRKLEFFFCLDSMTCTCGWHTHLNSTSKLFELHCFLPSKFFLRLSPCKSRRGISQSYRRICLTSTSGWVHSWPLSGCCFLPSTCLGADQQNHCIFSSGFKNAALPSANHRGFFPYLEACDHATHQCY